MKIGFPKPRHGQDHRSQTGNLTGEPQLRRWKTEQIKRKNRSTPNPKSRPLTSHRCYNRAEQPERVLTSRRTVSCAQDDRRRAQTNPEARARRRDRHGQDEQQQRKQGRGKGGPARASGAGPEDELQHVRLPRKRVR
ncbi:hypothetical protein F2Q70_00008426 [Brassica cretica]|uniref:Uncharacterized protein n=1 Tax=Brassica cretica TaxID=69181 RepID=A0A8S9LX98_BRACR|nr:hypothetical protein F2Q70_00008426 [Brassica cretica]KAF3543127.1 hypothetical protein DY000_02001920 [Brassica cretica]